MRRIFRRVIRTETTVTWTVTYSDDALTPDTRPRTSPSRLSPPLPFGPDPEPADPVQTPDPGIDPGSPGNTGIQAAVEGNQEIDP